MRTPGWVVLALWVVAPASAPAQWQLGLGGHGAVGTSVSIRYRSPAAAIDATRVTVFPSLGGHRFWGYPFLPSYAGFVPFAPAPYPWFGSPYAPGFGLSGATPLGVPSVVIAPPPVELPGDALPPPPPPNPPRGRAGNAPGNPVSRFRPVSREDRERARQPIPGEPAPPPRPVPPPDPKAIQGDFIRLGRDAFAARAYGRAVEQFRRAIDAAPEAAHPYFLLAQTCIALGKYAEAVAAIHQGMDRQPDWPTVGPPLLDLYQGQGATLSDHLRDLDAATAERPGDPTLLFLQAYVRWFDGRRTEARALFRRVRDRVTRPEVIDRFLGAEPGA